MPLEFNVVSRQFTSFFIYFQSGAKFCMGSYYKCMQVYEFYLQMWATLRSLKE